MAKKYVVNLSRVPEFARKDILEQIARDGGITVEDIVIEGV